MRLDHRYCLLVVGGREGSNEPLSQKRKTSGDSIFATPE